MFFKRLAVPAVLVLLLALAAGACTPSGQDQPVSRTTVLMGTVVQLKLYDPVDEAVFTKAFDLLASIEKKMSLTLPESELNAVNSQAGKGPVVVSPETFAVIERGLAFGDLSRGRFDITVGPLVSLWGIGTESARVPSPDEIEGVLERVDYRQAVLDPSERSVFLKEPGMALDLGGIAKGYAADALSDLLEEEGVSHAVISLGGNIHVHGAKPDGSPWRIGVQNPDARRNAYVGIVDVADQSVVTSGIYERFLESEGVRYHHLLSPFDGYPYENGLSGVSIIAGSSMDADALSTAAFGLGPEEGPALLESLPGVEGVFIGKDRTIRVTSGLRETFELTDADFTLVE